MKALRTTEQEAAEDIFFGQLVIVYARWFVVVAMTILVLWSSDSINQMVLGIAFVVPLIALNFFVHGRYLMEKPANRLLLILLSIIDALVISLIIAFWPGIYCWPGYPICAVCGWPTFTSVRLVAGGICSSPAPCG